MHNICHSGLLSDYRMRGKQKSYPIIVGVIPSAATHNPTVQNFAFDPEKVRQAMKAQRVSQAALREAVGLTSQSAVSNILNGTRQVKVEEARKIYAHLRLATVAGESTTNLPIIGLTGASQWREAILMPIGWMSIPSRVAGPKSFAVEVKGDSMDALIEDGGYIVIDPDRKELEVGRCYLIQNKEYEATVKMYARNPPRFEPVSSNKEHKPIAASDVDAIVGRVVWKGAPV